MAPFVFGLLATFALVLANAFFVASEFALVKFRPTQLQALVAQGNHRAKLALRMSERMDEYLSATQLGITLASIALGWIGEPTFAHALEPLLSRLGAWGAPAAHTLALVGSFVLITVLHVVLGELAPKSVAIQRTEPVALWTAAPLHAFYLVAFPCIWLLSTLSGLALRVFGLHAATERDEVQTPEELRLILRRVRLDPGARRLMDRLVDYTHRLARHVMTLRGDLTVLYTDRSFEENMHIAVENHYTRYLLMDRLGHVTGYVHLKDIASALATARWPESMSALARAPLTVREDTPLETLRRQFLSSGVLIAVVTDPTGALVGAVTLEDLLEAFVGEIRDEHDGNEIPPIVRGSDGRFELDGGVTLDVVTRELDFTLPDVPEGVETIGGYVRRRLMHAPHVGDVLEAGGVRLVVFEVSQRRIVRLTGQRHVLGATGASPGGERSSSVMEQ